MSLKEVSKAKNIREGAEREGDITAAAALKIALEDPETSFFIIANFSYPEQRPKIISRKWISRYHSGHKWNVVIIEKMRRSFKGEMKSVAIIEVDAASGKILRRQFFKNIFAHEYQRIVELLHR